MTLPLQRRRCQVGGMGLLDEVGLAARLERVGPDPRVVVAGNVATPHLRPGS